MTPREELLQKLAALRANQGRDQESDHFEADCALLTYVDDPEIEAAYDAIPKWYA